MHQCESCKNQFKPCKIYSFQLTNSMKGLENSGEPSLLSVQRENFLACPPTTCTKQSSYTCKESWFRFFYNRSIYVPEPAHILPPAGGLQHLYLLGSLAQPSLNVLLDDSNVPLTLVLFIIILWFSHELETAFIDPSCTSPPMPCPACRWSPSCGRHLGKSKKNK